VFIYLLPSLFFSTFIINNLRTCNSLVMEGTHRMCHNKMDLHLISDVYYIRGLMLIIPYLQDFDVYENRFSSVVLVVWDWVQ
jgi:hypothetical protein